MASLVNGEICSNRRYRDRQLERITVDTTVQTKAVAHPTDSHLLLRAAEWLEQIASEWTRESALSYCNVDSVGGRVSQSKPIRF